MHQPLPRLCAAFALLSFGLAALAQNPATVTNIQLGPRPYFLVSEMADSPLKAKLQSCSNGPFEKTDFSIGHRGAAMMFPEHTTTNILATPLAAKCTKAFTPYDAEKKTPASAECRASDITLAEFKTLRGKMDAINPMAKTAQEFMGGTAAWRTDLYSGPTSGTLMTHDDSIALFKKLGVKMTPELKAASVVMPFEGFTQEAYAQKMLDAYKAANVPASQVFAQSFNKNDILYWIKNEPAFGKQAVFLDGAEKASDLPNLETLVSYKNNGIQIVAPPIFALLDTKDGKLVASSYAKNARQAGLNIITWSLERSGVMATGKGGWYYQTVSQAIHREGDILQALDVLAKDVGIIGIFSDWPATVTYYANCMGIK